MLRLLKIILMHLVATAWTESLPSPTKIRVTERTKTSFTVSWEHPPSQVYEKFLVKMSSETAVVEPEDATSLSRSFSGLNPGERYTVVIQGFTGEDLSSSVLKYDVWTVPDEPTNMQLSAVQEIAISISIMGVRTKFTAFVDGMEVEWDDDSRNKVISGYDLQITPDDGVVVESDEEKASETVKRIITGLTPGKEYSVALRSRVGPDFDPVYSSPTMGKLRMPPAVPYAVEVIESEPTSVVLKTHGPLEGIHDDLDFQLRPNHGIVESPSPDPNYPMFNQYHWTGLKPGTRYELDTFAVSRGVRGYNPLTIQFRTAPAPPVKIKVVDFDHYSITLQWGHPQQFTDLDEVQYVIEFYEMPDGELQTATVKNFNKVDSQIVVQVQKLVPGSVYKFNVYTVLNGVKGTTPASVIQTTIPLKPTVTKMIIGRETGVKITFGEPSEGNCPSVKVFYSPSLTPEPVKPTFYQLGEEISFDEFPIDAGYSIHARCVSRNVEGPELVVIPSREGDLTESSTVKPGQRFDDPEKPRRTVLPCTSLMPAAVPRPDTIAPDSCCNSRPYNSGQKECCGGALLDKGGDRLCCENEFYNKKFSLCCDGLEGKFVRLKRDGCTFSIP